MEDWTIRRADIPDADGLGRCIDAAYAQYAGRIDDLPPMSEDCAAEIANHLVWVAEAGGEIVGGLVLIPSEGFMLLANVAVHPDRRGTGIGRRLLTLAETEALGRGYDEMRLNTHADMPENIQLYLGRRWLQVSRQGKKVEMRKILPR
ncbi:MAG: GNAT family N-acetyltransferase [Alphaproteobacteria bacterium]|jgi:GNAT superfamily N-acetyltransferase|nr:GNAT family N-acetyltransferase [Alphaproteobacteria bacterium]